MNTNFPDYAASLASGSGFDYHGHYLDNSGYLLDESDQLMVTEIFRFEERQEAMSIIAEKTGCPELLSPAPATYQTDRKHYSTYYDANSRRQIENLYAADLERFGYRYESG